jgi:hypothetical protein
MRELDPKPKARRKVTIPEELRSSFSDAWSLICEARDDPDINIDHGDAIQCGCVCGGRIGEGKREFHFTFYPPEDRRRGRWLLEVSAQELQDIAEGYLSDLWLFCCTSSTCRTKFSNPEQMCFHCDYRDDPEVVAKKQRLEERSKSAKSKQEWIGLLLEEFPAASASTLIGEYNSIDDLGERLGWFTLLEAQDLLTAVRRGDPLPAQPVHEQGPDQDLPDPFAARAEALVSELLASEMLELSSERSRDSLTSLVADLLAGGCSARDLGVALEDSAAVAELYASEDDLTRLIARFAAPET